MGQGADVSNPKGNRAEQALRKRFDAEERQAIDALTRWIGHHAVRGVIERRRIGAETVVMPIRWLLTNQPEVIRFCWHVFGLAGIEPGWELRKGEPVQVTLSEFNAIERAEGDFRFVVHLAVNELEAAGVGLVPSWPGDHVVVGQLLLLPGVDWEMPAPDLAKAMQPPAIGSICVDASGTSHRRGSGERANNNIGVLRRAYERHKYGEPPRAPYAGGGTRALSEATRLRRRALAEVLKRWPDVNASRIFTTFGDHGLQRGGQARAPGGYLRQLLEQAKPGEVPRRPSKSTLYEDLKTLRAAPHDKKPSS
jgi:hypothetical protein